MVRPELRRQVPFVGRGPELARLVQRLKAAREDDGGVILITGEAGIGKTRLISEVAGYARDDGWLVLTGRAYQADGLPPYLPWVEALREYIRAAPEHDLYAQLGEGAADIAFLVREVRARLPEVAPLAVESGLDRYRLFETVAEFLAAAASAHAGLLFVLDDLHWADTPSLMLFLHVARRLRRAPVLLAGTYRDTDIERGHPFAGVQADLVREELSEQLSLTGLAQDDVCQFVGLLAGSEPPDDLVGMVHRETLGNPLFMIELVRLLLDERRADAAGRPLAWRLTIPQSVQHVIGRRLDRLSGACNQVLTLAAVLGREFTLQALTLAAHGDTDTVLTALEEAEAARVVMADPHQPGRYGFTHPLIRETLYRQLLTSGRMRVHRQIGEALEAFYAANTEQHLAELAHHFVQAAPAGDAAKALNYTCRAADRSLAMLAYEDAASQYRTALDLLDLYLPADEVARCRVLLGLGEALTRAGETTSAKEAFLEAGDLAQRLGLHEELAQSALGYGGYRGTPGTADVRFIRLAQQALVALSEQPSALRARVQARLAMELYQLDERERRDLLSRQAIADARESGDPAALAATLVGRHYAMHEPANLAERLEMAAELVHLADAAGSREVALQGYYLLAIDAFESADIEAVDRAIAAHDQLANALRQPLYSWRTDLLRATRATLSGRFAEASVLARHAREVATRAQIANAIPAFGVQWFTLLMHTGGLEAMEASFLQTLEQAPRIKAYRAGLAYMYARCGREEEAQHHLDLLAAVDFRDYPRNDDFYGGSMCMADVCAQLGDRHRAELLADMLRPYANRAAVLNAAVACLGPVARPLGRLAALCERWDEAERFFESALNMARRIDSPPYIAHTQCDFAAMLLRRGRAGDSGRARLLVGEALTAARRLGMPYLEQDLTSLGDALNKLSTGDAVTIHPGTSANGVNPPHGLSPREAEVLRLLAAGRSNREIAEALVLSVRTIDHHVASAYRKIGARNRSDATAYVLTHGLIARPSPGR